MANKNVRWAARAWKQLNNALDYIETDSPKNAKKVGEDITNAMEKTIANPERHPLDKYKKDNDGSYRAFELKSYRVSYRIKSKEIVVLRVRHTSMEPKKY